jgi:hypothetical protein
LGQCGDRASRLAEGGCMSDRVYVVKANSGMYEDRTEWIAGIYTDIDEARKVAEEERSEDEDQYDSVYTDIETWTVGEGSERHRKDMWIARWTNTEGCDRTWHMEQDASDRPEDLDEDYPEWMYRGGNTEGEAEARLAEAMADRVSV